MSKEGKRRVQALGAATLWLTSIVVGCDAGEPRQDTTRRIAAPVHAAYRAAPDVDDPPPLDPEREPQTEPVHGNAAETIASVRATVGADDPDPVPKLEHRQWLRHKPAPRERIKQIAFRYGVAQEQLREWNGLSAEAEKLKPGTRLRIRAEQVPPRREKIAYTVVDGDTWWSVALRHGVDARDVRAYNYPSRNKMAPGSVLTIWIDPVVRDWIARGPDPLAPDLALALRRGAVGVGPPEDGWLINGVRIPKGEGYELRLPKSAYGTSHAVAQILIALAIFRERSEYAADLRLGAMSRARGGELKGHNSHQTGRDLDIQLTRRVEVPSWVALTFRRVDWLAVWQLVDALRQTDAQVIFLDYGAQRHVHAAARAAGITAADLRAVLQYPDGRSASGLVRHSDGHEQHLHVRVGCGPHEPECVE